IGREPREVAETDEADPPVADRPAHPRVAQRSQFHLALRGVARAEPRLHVAGMAGQLGHALPHLGVQQAKESFHADLLEMGFLAPLAVERRELAGPGVTANSHPVDSRPLLKVALVSRSA